MHRKKNVAVHLVQLFTHFPPPLCLDSICEEYVRQTTRAITYLSSQCEAGTAQEQKSCLAHARSWIDPSHAGVNRRCETDNHSETIGDVFARRKTRRKKKTEAKWEQEIAALLASLNCFVQLLASICNCFFSSTGEVGNVRFSDWLFVWVLKKGEGKDSAQDKNCVFIQDKSGPKSHPFCLSLSDFSLGDFDEMLTPFPKPTHTLLKTDFFILKLYSSPHLLHSACVCVCFFFFKKYLGKSLCPHQLFEYVAEATPAECFQLLSSLYWRHIWRLYNLKGFILCDEHKTRNIIRCLQFKWTLLLDATWRRQNISIRVFT